MKIRIGHSFDIHRLVENRKLILGGIEIPYEKGLLGHSDADVLLHAVAESILGALALGDLGTFFPDDNPKYKDLDSKNILKFVYDKMFNSGFEINNLDVTLYLEKPKLKNYKESIRKNISNLLNTDISNVSIKATTYEKLDAIGAGNAIGCDSVVLLKEK